MFKKYGLSVLIVLVIVLCGFTLNPSFARAEVAGPLNAGTGSNVTGIGTVAWTNPDRITSDDSYNSTARLSSNTSNYLKGSNYGFNIPSGSTINGIEVLINRSSSAVTLELGVHDSEVNLVKSGSAVGENKAFSGTLWRTTKKTVTYGSSADLWNTTWTPEEINDPNFGVVLSILSNDLILGRTASVNFIKVTVYYTAPIIKTDPTLSVTNSPVIYNGAPQSVIVTGSVDGTVSNVLYGGSVTAPTATGTYAITADFTPNNSVNYNSLTGASAGNFVINDAPVTLTSVSPLSDINVANGTVFGAIGLPTSVGVNLSDGNTPSLSVAWDAGTPAYDGSVAGSYDFSGTLTLPSGVTSSGEIKASVRVIVSAPIPTLDSLEITTPANKLSFVVGEELDITGLVVTGTYSDASVKLETVTIGDISGFDNSTTTTGQVLTITIGGKTATYSIDIVETQPDVEPVTPPSTGNTGGTGCAQFLPGTDTLSSCWLGGVIANSSSTTGRVLGTSTEKMVKEKVVKRKLTPEEKKARVLKKRLNHLKIAIYDLKHPQPKISPADAVLGTSTQTGSAGTIPLVPTDLTVSDSGEIVGTGTDATTTPKKKPFWKLW